MPIKDVPTIIKYALVDGTNGYVEIDATPQELENYLEECCEWHKVKHGHWEEAECGWKCSFCGGENELHPTPYCMWCGAKMEQT